MNTLIVIVSILVGMASMLLTIAGINWIYSMDPYTALCLNPAIAFPAATSLALCTCFMGMWMDAEHRREQA